MTVRLYDDLAGWYTLLTAPEDYEEEAGWFAERLREHARRPIKTVLELGCGSGANASFFKTWCEIVVVDLSPRMLEQCRRINPELEQHQGDMRSFRLGRKFDAVFVHDAASYLLTREDVAGLAATIDAHLEPGGSALVCPDSIRENFEPDTSSGGHDGPDGRGVRYLSWDVEGPDDTVYSDYVYMLRSSDGSVNVEHERHVTGRLPSDVWLTELRNVGLEATMLELEHSEVEPGEHHLFAATKLG